MKMFAFKLICNNIGKKAQHKTLVDIINVIGV